MLPSARVSAAIELTEEMLTLLKQPQGQPIDQLLGQYFKTRRYIGSKDKAAISGMLYGVLRRLSMLRWWLAEARQEESARLLIIAYLVLNEHYTPEQMATCFNSERYSERPLLDDEQQLVQQWQKQKLEQDAQPEAVRANLPDWLVADFIAALGDDWMEEARALGKEAPLDLRVNTLKVNRDEVLKQLRQEKFPAESCALSPIGVRLSKRGAIFTTIGFRSGMYEVQDEGSQLAALLVDAQPGMRVIDFCAGAGGKTLALAAQMQNKGRILAFDVSEKRLAQMKPRLVRAGVDNVQIHAISSESDAFLKRHKGTADRVLIDAPCSGSGTWRRNPDLKWKLTSAHLAELQALQQKILTSAARLVKENGRLVYVTCSLLQSENEQILSTFLAAHPNFTVVNPNEIWNKVGDHSVTKTTINKNNNHFQRGLPYFRTSPLQDGCDGFFAAVLECRSTNK